MLRIGPGFSSSSYTQPLPPPAAKPRKNVGFGKIDMNKVLKLAEKHRLSAEEADAFFPRAHALKGAEDKGVSSENLEKMLVGYIDNEAKNKRTRQNSENPVLKALEDLREMVSKKS